MDRILLVESEPRQRQAHEALLQDQGHRVVFAPTGAEAVERLTSVRPGLVVLGLPIAGMTALEGLAAIHAVEPKLPVIIVTAVGTAEEAIGAIRAGAFDYLLQPFADSELLEAVAQGVEAGRLTRSTVTIAQGPGEASGEALVGRSRPMQEIYKAIGRVAPTDSTVLIRGESGTGKELVARALYQHSARADRPFVVVNCVAIPETLLESELFGFEKGAFTGAMTRRIGKVEQAAGGSLFLDEIGDMPPAIQAKLLRLLQGRSIERIGGRRPIPVDVRIIAATNRDLEAAIEAGRFRTDLFYRLNVVPITLPPLRDRRDDVPLLCDYFMDRLTRELGVRNPGLTSEAYELLAACDWPGNVRELANAMEQLLIFCRGRTVGAAEVSALVLGEGVKESPVGNGDEALRRWVRRAVASGQRDLLPLVIDHVTREVVREVLSLTGGNRSRTARLLGLSRPTLLSKLTKYGLG